MAEPPLLLEHLAVRDFRNVTRAELRPGRRLTVFSGDNGQGKTSLLESIYFVATSKSFRTPRLGEVTRHGEPIASVRARLRDGEAGLGREQTASVDEGQRVVKVDDKRPPSLAAYAVRSPVVCFHGAELELSIGSAAARRTLLDRVSLFLEPASLDHHERYRRALRERQKALSMRGPEATDLDAYEELCARHGAAVTRTRERAAAAVTDWLGGLFTALAAPGLTLGASFKRGGSPDEDECRRELLERRVRDRVRGAPGFGPHRDELLLTLDGHPSRVVASQGQHRAITLALKLAEFSAIARARGVLPMLLLDDVSSELDAGRTSSLLALLGQMGAQIFLTTTRPELIVTPWVASSERVDFRLVEGRVESV
ncbi:MAG: DNA replication and repair protein RecF [Myxococcales bacterium]|nr:MAG: DNA replication and repair protein RecF [Myxococcales bacterium]